MPLVSHEAFHLMEWAYTWAWLKTECLAECQRHHRNSICTQFSTENPPLLSTAIHNILQWWGLLNARSSHRGHNASYFPHSCMLLIGPS